MRRLVNRHPGRGGALVLGALPFLLLVCVYLFASHLRAVANADDKLLPTPSVLASTIHSYAFEEDSRSGSVLFWQDTRASLERLFIALGLSAAIGLVFGVVIGVIPLVRSTLAPFVAALSMIPPLAILPILFIVLGLGEVAKIALMVIGVMPVIIRDLALRAVREGRLYAIRLDEMLRPGPRLADGLVKLAEIIHPDAFGRPGSAR